MLQNDVILRELLRNAVTVAVVGAKDKPGSPADMVGRALIEDGLRVLPVHPARKTVWGLPAVKSLLDLDQPVDIVNLFRAPHFCPEHAREVLSLAAPPKCFWMQSGIESPEAREILRDSGIVVVADRCLMVERRRLLA